MSTKPTFSAFNLGEKPTIACFNQAKTPLGVDLDDLIAVLQAYVNNFVAPVWGTPATLVRSDDFLKGAWAVSLLDDSDQANILGFHNLTDEGLPLSKVFVRTTLANGELVSVSASHELVEMLVDPAINLMTTGPDPALVYAYESADPVEALSFPVNGIPMSDFVYPSYFENFHAPHAVRFDQMDAVSKPFEILKDGYQIVFENGNWRQIFGSKAKEEAFAKEDRKQHRSEDRKLKRTDWAHSKERSYRRKAA